MSHVIKAQIPGGMELQNYMAIIDVFTFNGEREILKLHLSILGDYVDKFIIVEANKTFSGYDKPLYFFRDQRYFKPWWKKIEYYVVNDWEDEGLWDLARNSPNTKGAAHWQQEFYIKESIKKALIKAKVQDDDVVYLGDVDEIWSPYEAVVGINKLKLKVYAYYLNNRSNEEFWGTVVAPYRAIKDKVFNHIRSHPEYRTEREWGWHFTSMGGLKEVQRKLNDSYTTESYNTAQIQELLPERHRKGSDYLGRDFTFQIDESQWPDYLTKNKAQYKHLLWPQ